MSKTSRALCVEGCGRTVLRNPPRGLHCYSPMCRKCAKRNRVRLGRLECKKRKAPRGLDEN